jgi:hypothetical protein
LTGLASEAGRRDPVFSLDVDANNRVGPIQKVRDNDAGALSCPGRSGERYPLLAWQHQAAAPEPAEDDSVIAQ